MPGTPKLRQLVREIEELGGEDYIFERVADGDSIKVIMEPFGVSRFMFYKWLKRADGGRERREAAYAEAKRVSADAHAEDSGEILEDLARRGPPTGPEVQLANSRSNYRRWLAGVRSEEYRDQSGPQVTVQVGSLHLDALRAHGRMGEDGEARPARVLEAEVVDEPALGLPDDAGSSGGEVSAQDEPWPEPADAGEDPLAELMSA